MVITAIRLYYIYKLDFADITFSAVAPSNMNTIQIGIAVMVASAPLLRPVFDRTLSSWFGISLRSTGDASSRPSGNPDRDLRTFGRSAPGKGFQHISDSEEHLRWELSHMGTQRYMSRETKVSGTRTSNDSSDTPHEGIVVTKSTIVEA